MNVVAIIQARLGSQRLPGKVVADLGGQPMLARVVERVACARLVDRVAVATTDQPGDDELASLCERRGWECYRGSEHDVLDRYARAAQALGATHVVRITSDCPLLDPELVDVVVRRLLDESADYASNTVTPRTFPRGLDVEAMTLGALIRAFREDTDPASREHVTPYIWRRPEEFSIVGCFSARDRSALRWTVDTREDLAAVAQIYAGFEGPPPMAWEELLIWLEGHPEIVRLNAHVVQKAVT